MTENYNSEAIGEAARQSGAAFKQGVKAAKDGLDYAQGHLDDGFDLVRGWVGSLNDFVSAQPLMAVAGAFLIGYMAARMLRRVSST
jgi:hypothetical protein